MILGINGFVFLAVFLSYYQFSKRTVVRETQKMAMEKVSNVVSVFDGFIKEKTKIAWTFSQSPLFLSWLETSTERTNDHSADTSYQKIMTFMKDLVRKDKGIKAVFFASERTQQYYANNFEEGTGPQYYIRNRPWYQELIAENKALMRTAIDTGVDSTLVIAYNFPVYNDAGELLGAAGIDIGLNNIRDVMSQFDVFETGEAFLLQRDTTIAYHTHNDSLMTKKLDDVVYIGDRFRDLETTIENIMKGQSGIDRLIYNGVDRYFIYAPIPDLGCMLVLSVSANEMNNSLKALARTSVVIAIFAFIILMTTVIIISKSISNPIWRIVVRVRDIAEGDGDLTKRLRIERDDEIGELAKWFNVFIEKLHDIVWQVKENTNQVASATGEISATSAQLASGAEEQNSQASEVATSVHEMTAAIVENSQNAMRSVKIAEEANSKAAEGSEVMQETLEGMEEIVMSTAKTGEIVDTLSQRTDQIGEIIRVIDDIADQTNLLALNAAIEAARAGEQGRGFAVVADEVRKLAERTSNATKEIVEMIGAIQSDTRGVSESMGAARTVVNHGKEMAIKTKGVLGEIIGSVNRAMEMISQIAAASEEMSGGAEEISKSVESISTVTRESASGAEQMAATADRLTRQTENLKTLVNRFKLRDDQTSLNDNSQDYHGYGNEKLNEFADREKISQGKAVCRMSESE